MDSLGYVHLYYGMGKGKTSILNGMALRAMGYDWKVKYHRFLKNRFSGEDKMFARLPMEFVSHYHSGTKFFWEMNEQERALIKAETRSGFQALLADAQSGDYDLILVDELFDCVVDDLLTLNEIVDLIASKAVHTEMAFSAHQVDATVFAHFDLISELKPQKHYFETRRVMAREGIEY